MIRRAFLLLAAVFVSGVTAGAQGVQLPGALDWLLTDAALWQTPVGMLPEKYKDAGYKQDPMSSAYGYLRTPVELMEQKAHLIMPEAKVWKVTFGTSDKVRYVLLDFMPAPGLAKVPGRTEFRALTRLLEEGLTTRFKTAAVPGQIDYVTQGQATKWTCVRWSDARLQAVLTTVAEDKGSLFTPKRLELKLLPSVPPGKPPTAQAPVAKPDRTTGAVVLEGMPAEEEWDGHLAQWLPLEQALHAAGKASDRNTILECNISTGYPLPFAQCIRRIVTASGGKLRELTPFMHMSVEMDRVAKLFPAAAKKLGKPAPQDYLHFINIDPEVLREARTGGNAVPGFTASLKQSLTAGRPVLWYGWKNYYPENPHEEGAKPAIVTRLITGYAAKENQVIFAGASGTPGVRMKAGDALASAVWMVVLQPK